jgi:signal transduction histidine kinase
MMFRSVRTRLIVSYAAIIFLCLLLAGLAFGFLLRDYQSRIKLDQLGRLAFSVSYQVRLLESLGASSVQIGGFLKDLAAETDVRFLLTDQGGRIIQDSAGDLTGVFIGMPSQQASERQPFITQLYHTRNEEGFLLVLAIPRLTPISEVFLERPSAYTVILAVPETDLQTAWLELAPIFALAGSIALIVSVLVALLISRTISRPIAQITTASEQIAQGHYDQFIPVSGHDEVGRLATTFNAMAQQVAESHRTTRDFLANVSHELKTPLTSIQGFSQAMVDGSLRTPADYQEAGQIINEEAERMRRLVEDLLFLSKIESGQIGMRQDIVDLGEVLREAVRRYWWQADQNQRRLDLHVDDLPPVRGDARWLGQAFSNLLDNALKFTPRTGEISVSARKEIGSIGPGVRIIVQNSGSFIPDGDLQRIFERFYQVDKSRAKLDERLEGSGLGLAIVKEIVQAHSGVVTARSDSRSGTAFDIWLPAVAVSTTGPGVVAVGRTTATPP